MSEIYQHEPETEHFRYDRNPGRELMESMVLESFGINITDWMKARTRAGIPTGTMEVAGGNYWGSKKGIDIDLAVAIRQSRNGLSSLGWDLSTMAVLGFSKRFYDLPINTPGVGTTIYGDMYSPAAWESLDQVVAGSEFGINFAVCIPQLPFNYRIVGEDRENYLDYIQTNRREFKVPNKEKKFVEAMNWHRVSLEIAGTEERRLQFFSTIVPNSERMESDFQRYLELMQNITSRLERSDFKAFLQVPMQFVEFVKEGQRPYVQRIRSFLTEYTASGLQVGDSIDSVNPFDLRTNNALLKIQSYN